MTRSCDLTGKSVQYGNNVSHSNRKSRRSFLINLQSIALYSEALGNYVPLRLAANTIRTVDKKGGLDAFLLTTSSIKLAPAGVKLKARVRKALAAKKAA